MKTVLLLADFSDTCNNTLKYAANLANAVNTERIILLKSHYTSVYAQLLPSADFIQMNAESIDEEIHKEDDLLNAMVQQLTGVCHPGIKVEVAHSQEPLLRAMREVIAEQKPDLVMMGSDAADAEESAVGQQLVEVAKISTVPVLVIPCGVSRQPLQRVLVPADFSAMERLSLLSQLQNLQFATTPELVILNVDPQKKHLSHEAEQVAALREFLESYQYTVAYSDDSDKVRGILNFANHNDVQLIVALPGKHSFFYNLTHNSITEALATNSRLPVLILK